jgi:hypothetical protein
MRQYLHALLPPSQTISLHLPGDWEEKPPGTYRVEGKKHHYRVWVGDEQVIIKRLFHKPGDLLPFEIFKRSYRAVYDIQNKPETIISISPLEEIIWQAGFILLLVLCVISVFISPLSAVFLALFAVLVFRIQSNTYVYFMKWFIQDLQEDIL